MNDKIYQINKTFMNLYQQLGLSDSNGLCHPLHETCKFKDVCWENNWNRVPSEESSHISRPWIGKSFHKLRLLIVGINMNEHGGFHAIEELFNYAKVEIHQRRRLRFKNDFKKYAGTLVYHRLGSYAAIITHRLGLLNISYDKDGFPSADHINKAFDYIAFTNQIKCSPREDKGKPTEKMWENCGGHILAKEISILSPKIILVLGISANAWAFKHHVSKEIKWNKIGENKESAIFHSKILLNKKNINIFVTPHPHAVGVNQKEIINNLGQGLIGVNL